MKASSSRQSLHRTLLATATAAASLALASPAHAVEYPAYANKANGQCLQGTSADNPVLSYACDNGSDQDWEIESRPQTGTSNQVVKLRNVRYNRCLDSYGGVRYDAPYTVGCNSGNYQLWEVFINSNGTRTFKSWGAWKHQGLHLCLSSSPSGPNASDLLNICNRNSDYQQWHRRD